MAESRIIGKNDCQPVLRGGKGECRDCRTGCGQMQSRFESEIIGGIGRIARRPGAGRQSQGVRCVVTVWGV